MGEAKRDSRNVVSKIRSYIFDYDEDDYNIILELSKKAGYECGIDFMNDMLNETIKQLIKKDKEK